MVTEDDYGAVAYHLPLVSSMPGSMTVLVNFAIDEGDMSKEIASYCILRLVWSRQLNNLGQVVQHNPSIEGGSC